MNTKLSYNESKALIHPMKIKSSAEYFKLFKERKIPSGIPRNPPRDYSDFVSWGDFLNNGIISNKYLVFKSYEECQDYLFSNGIDSKEKFEKWRKVNKNTGVPSRPDQTYKNQWESWGTFFKTDRIPDQMKHKMFYDYEKAKEYLKQFNFKSESEFYKWTKSKERPYFIPASPKKTYKNIMPSMADFLSSGFVKKEFKNYENCKFFVQSLKFNSIKDFKDWISSDKRDLSVPSNPHQIYDEFEGWAVFLGYNPRVSTGEKLISSILVSNSITHSSQYKIKECKDVSPLAFDVAILKANKIVCLIEYQGIQHFKAISYFGGERALILTQKRDKIKREFCENNKIKLITISYKENAEIKLQDELKKIKIDIDLSLEREPAENRKFLKFEECKKLIKELKIKSAIEYKKLKKLSGMPYNPEIQYKHSGWVSWGDFLGTNKIQSKKAIFVSFEECKKWFKDNFIKSGEDWKMKRKNKPNYIPCNPNIVYSTQWKGWKDFLYN